MPKVNPDCPSCGGAMSTRTGELRCEKCGFILPMSIDSDLELNSPIAREKRYFMYWYLAMQFFQILPHNWIVYEGSKGDWLDWRRAGTALAVSLIFLPITYIFLRWLLFSRVVLIKRIFLWWVIIGAIASAVLQFVWPDAGLAVAAKLDALRQSLVYLSYLIQLALGAWFIRLMLIDLNSLRSSAPQEGARV